MKLSEIKTSKLLLNYIAEFILKLSNFEAVHNVVLIQKETNTIKASLIGASEFNADLARVTSALVRLNKLNGGNDRIRAIYATVKDENVKKRFAKYIQ
jgi:hypothetical protein